MKRSDALLIGVLVLLVCLLVLVVTVLFSSHRTTDSRQTDSQESTGESSVVESDQLEQRAQAFVAARYMKLPDDTPEVLRERLLGAYATEQYVDERNLDISSNADVSFQASGHSMAVEFPSDPVTAELNDQNASVADVHVAYDAVLVDSAGEEVDRYDQQSYTVWEYSQQHGWRLYGEIFHLTQ